MEDGEIRALWSIKNVVTIGIRKEEGCEIKTINGTVYACRESGHCTSANYLFQSIGSEIFETEEQAVAQAKTKLRRKLASLDKQQKKVAKILADLEKKT